jgi:DNA repair ATPase RecN
MGKNDSAAVIESLISELAGIARGLRDSLKKVEDFQNELKKSKDMEFEKLKQTIQKRNQMFDMLSQITEKYNQTAKDVITKLGR